MGYLLPEAIDSTQKPYLLVKIKSQVTSGVLSNLQKTWESMSAGLPFEFTFLDDKVNSLYQNDNRAGKIVTLFSCLAIFVSCLGLFGLAAFVAEQRTKEIGVRKVLGAPLSNIMWLLIGQFVKWVIVANLIAWPVGYWIMNRWLQGFAFRASLSLWIFLASGLAALAIATELGVGRSSRKLAGRARKWAWGGLLLGLPLLVGQILTGLDYTVTRDVRAGQLIDALQRHYEKESLYPENLEELVEAGDLAEIPRPRIGFAFVSQQDFLYQSFGTSYVLEFSAPRWIQCAYNPPYLDEYEEEEEEELEDLGGSWSCPSKPPELW